MKRTLLVGIGILMMLQGCQSDYSVKGNQVVVPVQGEAPAQK